MTQIELDFLDTTDWERLRDLSDLNWEQRVLGGEIPNSEDEGED